MPCREELHGKQDPGERRLVGERHEGLPVLRSRASSNQTARADTVAVDAREWKAGPDGKVSGRQEASGDEVGREGDLKPPGEVRRRFESGGLRELENAVRGRR
jgi:hypothetical protein